MVTKISGTDGVTAPALTAVGAAVANSFNMGLRGQRSNLKITYTGTSGVVACTADRLIVEDAAGQCYALKNINLTAVTGLASGVIGSLDAGTWAFSSFYNVFVAYNPTTQTTGLLFSLATTPVLSAGYTAWARVGANKTQAATNYWMLGGNQFNTRFQYKVAAGSNVTAMPILASGVIGNPTTPLYIAVNTLGLRPTSAFDIDVTLHVSTSATQAQVAPNGSYGAFNSTTNPPPLSLTVTSATQNLTASKRIILETSDVYFASNDATAVLCAAGWEDNL